MARYGTRTAVGIGRCDDCGQTRIISDREPGVFLCSECRDSRYGGDERRETQRLFEPVRDQLPGQTTMEGMS
jgi:ribosomal protein L37AE/L43A